MIILNRQWTRTPASVTLLKRIVASNNQLTRDAASNALNNLQSGGLPAGLASPIGFFAPPIEAEAWVNGKPPSPAELRGKVLLVSLPATAGASPDLPALASQWQAKFEREGL